MGGFFETDKMINHVAGCTQCKAAHPAGGSISYMDCCDEYSDMFNNVIDFESHEGPWEDKPDTWLMCDRCDSPIDPQAGRCAACGYSWCIEEDRSNSHGLCGNPAVETVGGRPCCEEHKL